VRNLFEVHRGAASQAHIYNLGMAGDVHTAPLFNKAVHFIN